MYVGSDFDPSDTAEDEIYTLDFVNDLVTGETIASASWSCAVITGTDPSPASRVSGSASKSGSQTSQRFNGFIPGVSYQLIATVVTSLGNTKKLWSHVQARNPD
jgi:hypothetical protein